VGGQIVLTASAAFAAGLQAQSLIILNDNSYVPQRYQRMLFYWAILLYSAAINIWGSKALPGTNFWAGVLHISGFVAIMAVLGALSPKSTAQFVFTEFTNSSGWKSDGVSWLVGLLSTVYPMLGYDAAAHVSEEIPSPGRNVPLVMVGTVVLNSIMGFGYCIMLLYSTGPLQALLATPTGFPFMQIYLNATRSPAGATVMSLILILIATAASAAGMTSTSRTLWAFARDGAIPFSHYFSKVSEKKEIPVRAVAVTLLLQLLLGFIYIGNTTAFDAVLSMAIIGMYLSYLMPIVVWLIHGRPKMQRSEFGSFYLGRVFGIILNLISIIWLVTVIIFSTFPGSMPVTVKTMNYSSVVMAGWLLCGAIYYFAGGWKKFNVPVVEKTGSASDF
jgi:amino acid transporter